MAVWRTLRGYGKLRVQELDLRHRRVFFGFVRVFCVDFSNRDLRLKHVRIVSATSANFSAPMLLVAAGDLAAAAQVAMVAKFLGNYLVVSPALMSSFLLAVAEAS